MRHMREAFEARILRREYLDMEVGSRGIYIFRGMEFFFSNTGVQYRVGGHHARRRVCFSVACVEHSQSHLISPNQFTRLYL